MLLTPLQLPVTVEYDCHGKRRRKTLPDSWAARRCLAQKLKQGRNHKIITLV
jgi:hypothetical protein